MHDFACFKGNGLLKQGAIAFETGEVVKLAILATGVDVGRHGVQTVVGTPQSGKAARQAGPVIRAFYRRCRESDIFWAVVPGYAVACNYQ